MLQTLQVKYSPTAQLGPVIDRFRKHKLVHDLNYLLPRNNGKVTKAWCILCLVIELLCVVCYNVCLLVGCLSSQQNASVSQEQICSDNFTCCHTEVEAADQTYTDTRPTSPSTDSTSPGTWQGSRWFANFYVTGMTRPGKMGFEPRIFRSRGKHLNH